MLGLVLGGGGAKGYAHIGVIKLLEEIGIKPDIVVGASMGSLVSGFYAKGYSAQQMEEIALTIDKKKKRELFKIHISKKGFFDGKNVVRFLKPYLGDTKIEELTVKYAAIATDLEQNCEIVIDRGDLIQAIRSSISVPIFFIPNNYQRRILIDGGFVNPVPIGIAKRLGAEKIIAVNVLPHFAYPGLEISFKDEVPKSYSIKDVFFRTFDLITSRLIDYEVEKLENGILMDIDTKEIGFTQFEKAKEAIERGYNQAKQYKEKLLQLFKS